MIGPVGVNIPPLNIYYISSVKWANGFFCVCVCLVAGRVAGHLIIIITHHTTIDWLGSRNSFSSRVVGGSHEFEILALLDIGGAKWANI